MIDETALREGLKKLLTATEADIRARVEEEPALKQALEARHKAAAEAGRTAPGAWLAFRDEAVTQAAVHWLLACVFVRFLEDNDLVEEAWISGPKRESRDLLNEARDRRVLWYGPDQHGNDADYLLHVFTRTAELPGMAGLFDRAHNPLWSLAPTGPQAMAILQFFQARDEATSELRYDFTDPDWNTRFLGDLYQNLSEFARKRYALCQTPGFVVDFILDRTLTPALDVFGLEQTRLIDPTCGSGHFLLAAFDMLFTKWMDHEPNENPRVLAQRALNAVYGVDLNPFAVEVAEFRLLIAALGVSGTQKLKNAPNFTFQLACGDSLLHGRRPHDVGGVQAGLYGDRVQFFYATEDAENVKRVLSQAYQVVVGNPPYISVSDLVLREAYRDRFPVTCHRSYQLSAPFAERFFDLAVWSEPARSAAGWVGMIVSNAFMKRAFGKKLVENYLSFKDLTYVIDTSGAYIPGHTTPTAILIGRNQHPVAPTIRAVRGIRADSTVPVDPATAPVWREIEAHVDDDGFHGDRVSVANAARDSFNHHPWALGGGGAAELSQSISQAGASVLGDIALEVGRIAVLGEEDAWFSGPAVCHRASIGPYSRPYVTGEDVRDWIVRPSDSVVYPYVSMGGGPIDSLPRSTHERLWPNRYLLSLRSVFRRTMVERGKQWFELLEHYTAKLKSPRSITFGYIATHNHFSLDDGGKLFNRHAPVIKLPDNADIEHYLSLLGLLNSSVTCFWLKQVCQSKGAGGISGGLATELWEYRYEFDGAAVKRFPIPAEGPIGTTKVIQSEVDALKAVLPERLLIGRVPTRATIDVARRLAEAHLARLFALQEELDWQVYHLYDLLDEDLSLPLGEVPPLKLGERPFEILMARQMAAGELETTWFERHGSTPITELPSHWPEQYRSAVEHRLEIIATNRDIALIEQPEYKRRWNLPKWDDLEQKALENWLLDRMESAALWAEPELKSCARLADVLRRDAEFTQVAELAEGCPDYDIAALVKRIALKHAVPFLPVLRYKLSGLEKRREWEKTWEMQRREDAGEVVKIEVPPKYRSADFQDSTWWSLRGSLDVPKERFILYSGLEGVSDTSPVIGWAGWNHLQQAQALTTYYQHVKADEAWALERLKPVLAGLLDLIPWVKQWHNDPDPATGDRMGDSFATFLETECQEWGMTVESLRDWTPLVGRTSRSASARKPANARARQTDSPTAPPPESVEDKVI